MELTTALGQAVSKKKEALAQGRGSCGEVPTIKALVEWTGWDGDCFGPRCGRLWY